MRLPILFSRRGVSNHSTSGRSRAVGAASRAAIEQLESRRLLTVFTIDLGAHTVELRPGQTGLAGDVQVFVDNAFAYQFEDGQYGTDIVDCRGESVTCYDEVPAVTKPQSSGGGSIGFVDGGTGSTLQLNAGYYDRKISVSSSTSDGTTVLTSDENDSAAGTDSYDSTFSHLTIRANDYAGGTSSSDGTGVDVPSFYGDGALTVDTGAGTWDTIRLGNDGGSPVTNAKVLTGAGNDWVILSTKQEYGLPGRSLVASGAALASDPLPSASATIDFGSGDSGEFGLNDALWVGPAATATIQDNIGDGHTVVVDAILPQVDSSNEELNVEGEPARVIIASRAKVQDLTAAISTDVVVNAADTHFDNLQVGGTAEIQAPTTIDNMSEGSTNSLITFESQSGTSAVQSITPTANITVEAGATLDAGGPDPSNLLIHTLQVAGTVLLKSPAMIAQLLQSGGLVKLDQPGTWRDRAQANEIDVIEIAAGLLDLHGQDLLTTTNTDTIRAYLSSAYDGGGSTAWQGTTGITSTLMYGPAHWYGIGYAASGHANVIPSIPFGKVLLRPTMFGDTNMDGTTDDADLSAENAGGHTWADGDWNYDGIVNGTDSSDLAAAGTYDHIPALIYPGNVLATVAVNPGYGYSFDPATKTLTVTGGTNTLVWFSVLNADGSPMTSDDEVDVMLTGTSNFDASDASKFSFYYDLNGTQTVSEQYYPPSLPSDYFAISSPSTGTSTIQWTMYDADTSSWITLGTWTVVAN